VPILEDKKALAISKRHAANDIREQITFLSIVCDMSKINLWDGYKKSLTAMYTTKTRTLLAITDTPTIPGEEGAAPVSVPIAYRDRERAVLCAEARLIDLIVSAPERAERVIPALNAEVESLEAAADDIDDKYRFNTKGA